MAQLHRGLIAAGVLLSLAIVAGCGGDGAVAETPAGESADGSLAPTDELEGRGEVLELEHHRLRIVTAEYNPNSPETARRDVPASVGFTYLQLLVRVEGIPEDRKTEPPFSPVIQIDYPECEEAYEKNQYQVTRCLNVLGAEPDTTGYQTAEQVLNSSPYASEELFEPGVPYFATFYYTVDEQMLPTDPQLCYIPDTDLFWSDNVRDRCIAIGEIAA